MNKLRNEFEDEAKSKFSGIELLFETSSEKYIKWLEEKYYRMDKPCGHWNTKENCHEEAL